MHFSGFEKTFNKAIKSCLKNKHTQQNNKYVDIQNSALTGDLIGSTTE